MNVKLLNYFVCFSIRSKIMKGTKWLSFEFDDNSFEESSAKKTKFSPAKNVTSIDNGNSNSDTSKQQPGDASTVSDWSERFSPQAIGDLCVHNKKIQEVEQWLKSSILKHGSSMLLLSGPAGCGKTVTLQLLAKQLGLNVSEWITPMDVNTFERFEYSKFDAPVENQLNKFTDFIIKSSCYRSLFSQSQRIVLVEDFPNGFLRKPSDFHNALQKYNDKGKSPIVFICTESREENLNLIWNLFPQAIQEQFNIVNISFNAVSATGMKVALKRMTTIMSKSFSSSYNVVTPELIDCVINSSLGDVRSAVVNLHFACLKGQSLPMVSSQPMQLPGKANASISAKSRKKEINKSNKFNKLGKNESITLMHGVGRVLNPKFIDNPLKSGEKQLTHSPQTIVEQFSVQPVQFLGFLHENYISHYGNVHDMWKAAEGLSDSDYLMNEWREKYGKLYGLHVSIAGLMLSNKSPVSAWHPVRGPKNMKVQYPFLKLDTDDDCHYIQGKVLATDYKTYFNIIKKSDHQRLDEQILMQIFNSGY